MDGEFNSDEDDDWIHMTTLLVNLSSQNECDIRAVSSRTDK